MYRYPHSQQVMQGIRRSRQSATQGHPDSVREGCKPAWGPRGTVVIAVEAADEGFLSTFLLPLPSCSASHSIMEHTVCCILCNSVF